MEKMQTLHMGNEQLDHKETWDTDKSLEKARDFYELGHCYEAGIYLEADIKKAIQCYRKSALMGYPPAQNGIGFLHATGKGVPYSEELAIEWFKKAAKAGHSGAQMNLGVMYSEGRGTKQNNVEALCLFYKAAIAGNHDAQEFLGHAHEDGLCGLEKDHKQAEFWLEQAHR
ncbi:MAG: sel1 repeat family protein [Gammaproteobacteria bacterium]|nr:MAG: sel1 repeat family protein [Gammaproteobacteria bacterium]